MNPRGFPSWDELYRSQPVESMPWYLPGLDPDLEEALRERGLSRGRILDLGTGPGTQALALAERGFEVTGSDISAGAVQGAAERAGQRGLTVRFLQDDILESRLEGPFDAIIDRGCFHVLAPEHRPTYVQTVARLLAPGGLLLLKCFSDEQPGTEGPYRFRPEAIREAFSGTLEVLSIERTEFQGGLAPPLKALICVSRKA